MSSHEWIEKLDASRGIPRKANEQYLPAYQAFWAWAGDIGRSFVFSIFGLTGAFLSLFSGYLLDAVGFIWLIFWSLALVSIAAAFIDIYSLCWSYRLWTMSTSHGSARWARVSDLLRWGLINRLKGMPLPKNSLPIAKVFGGRDLFLPKEQWLRHFVMFGPTGSGKSKTFFMTMIRAVLRRSSCLVYDPKGELCEQTASSARRVFRLDLNHPERSDRWNFVPLCRKDPAFACQMAGMMLGIENRRKTNADPFWGDAEQIALTAILLHIAEVYCERAIPAFAADFLLSLDEEDKDAFGNAMKSSPSFYAKQAYLAFRQAPYQTRGSILIGLYNKLRPFALGPARMVSSTPSAKEIACGCRLIDFGTLRKPGTAIYLVVSEGAADMYKEFIATFLGQAVLEMRLDGVNEPKYPCFVMIDEAYQLNVAEVKRISGIGRGRGVGLGLGYQDLPQMYDQYGKEQANAILGTVMTKIFLPGLDDVTAEYASKQLGDTTILSKTFQDFPGKRNDNIRYAEQKRALMHAAEIRQIAAHKELLVVSDTAPPIKAAYPPLAIQSAKFETHDYGKPSVLHLGDIDPAFHLGESSLDRPAISNVTIALGDQLENIVSDAVESVLTDASFFGNRPEDGPVFEKAIEFQAGGSAPSLADALNTLSDDVRAKLQEQYERSLLEISRSVI
jgi:type IV secretion system protein VirD4